MNMTRENEIEIVPFPSHTIQHFQLLVVAFIKLLSTYFDEL